MSRVNRTAAPTKLTEEDRQRLRRVSRNLSPNPWPIRALWAVVILLAAYVAPHAVEHVRTSPAFDPPAKITAARGQA